MKVMFWGKRNANVPWLNIIKNQLFYKFKLVGEGHMQKFILYFYISHAPSFTFHFSPSKFIPFPKRDLEFCILDDAVNNSAFVYNFKRPNDQYLDEAEYDKIIVKALKSRGEMNDL